jgi:hypothetical protein
MPLVVFWYCRAAGGADHSRARRLLVMLLHFMVLYRTRVAPTFASLGAPSRPWPCS